MHSGAQINKSLRRFYEGSQQIRPEHVDGEDVLEAIARLDSALPITDSGVVNDRVQRSQTVGLIGESPSLGDAREIAYYHSVGLRGRSLRVAGTTLVAGVEYHLVTGGQQPLRGQKAETVG